VDPLTRGAFVGREAELDALRDAVARACAGSGRLVLLSGEPGIGKTRLVSELAAGCPRLGARVLWGRCWEGKGAPAFWPWIQIARAVVRDQETDALRGMLGPAASDVAELVPELRDRLPTGALPPALEADQARFRLFDSVTQLFTKTASATPLVLILDDLHWADAASARLLEFLAGELSATRMLIIAAYRPVELCGAHPLTHAIGELARHPSATRMTLRGLDASAVASLIEAGTGVVPPPTLALAVRQKTDGNPLFVAEIVRLLNESGGGTPAGALPPGLTVPPTIREAVGRRVHRLSEDDLSVLTVASVVGREFDVAILTRIVEPSEHVLSALHRATLDDIVQPIPQILGRYRFAHVLFRDVLYDQLPLAERLRWHRRVGEALEALSGDDPSPPLDTLAEHFFHAAPAGDVDKAIEYAERAAQQAVRMVAYEEAVGHYRRAVSALQLKRAAGERICAVRLALGDAERRAGLIGDARSTFEQAAAGARRLGSADLLARAALGLGEPWTLDPAQVDELLIDLLAEALRALPADDGALRIMVMARLAWALCTSAAERGAALTKEALAAADRTRHPRAYVFALAARHFYLWRAHDLDERLDVTRELLRTAEVLGDREAAIRGHLYHSFALLSAGDIAGVDEQIDAATWLAAELRQPRYLWQTALLRGMRLLLKGDYAQADRVNRDVARIGRRDHAIAEQNVFAQVMALHRDRGGLEALIDPARALAAKYPANAVWRCALASIHAQLGREAPARGEFEELARNAFEQIVPGPHRLISLALLGEVCAFLQDPARARILYEMLTPFAAQTVVVGSGAVCEGPVARVLGILATTLSSWTTADEQFRAALEMNNRLGAPALAARTQCAYARMLLARRAAGDRRAAEALLSRALIDAQALGAGAVVVQIETLRRALGNGRSPATRGGAARTATLENAPHPPAGARPTNVFRREGQYWRIAYKGSSVNLRSTKGLELICHLLRNPGVEIHVVDLAALRSAVQPLDVRGASSPRTLAARSPVPLDCGVALDPRAKAAYRERLDDLRERLADAERCHDVGQADRARTEIDFLTRHLAASVGLNGRPRPAGSIGERARVSVRNDISRALHTIREHHQELWRHLCNSIKTGTFCSYQPDESVPWTA
jgi:tetratricopeptide (TPR) repeat protein